MVVALAGLLSIQRARLGLYEGEAARERDLKRKAREEREFLKRRAYFEHVQASATAAASGEAADHEIRSASPRPLVNATYDEGECFRKIKHAACQPSRPERPLFRRKKVYPTQFHSGVAQLQEALWRGTVCFCFVASLFCSAAGVR